MDTNLMSKYVRRFRTVRFDRRNRVKSSTPQAHGTRQRLESSSLYQLHESKFPFHASKLCVRFTPSFLSVHGFKDASATIQAISVI